MSESVIETWYHKRYDAIAEAKYPTIPVENLSDKEVLKALKKAASAANTIKWLEDHIVRQIMLEVHKLSPDELLWCLYDHQPYTVTFHLNHPDKRNTLDIVAAIKSRAVGSDGYMTTIDKIWVNYKNTTLFVFTPPVTYDTFQYRA